MNTFKYEYEMPGRTCDTVLFYVPARILLFVEYYNQSIQVLLVKRFIEPYKHHWCLPGGFMEISETLEEAAIREIREESGVNIDNLIFNKMYDWPARHTSRVLSAGFIGILTQKQEPISDGIETSEARWFNLDETGKLEFAFDHKQILREGYEKFCSLIPI